jgi:hypothetical protein
MAKSHIAANVESFVAPISDGPNSIDDFTPPLLTGPKRCNTNELAMIGAKVAINMLQRIKQEQNENYQNSGYLRQWRHQAKAARIERNKPA